MKVRSGLVFAALFFAILCGCDKDSMTCYDHSWEVKYFVSNTSDQDLLVEFGPASCAGDSEVIVAAGDTELLFEYTEFLGPSPDAGRFFWGISVRSISDSVLVHQLCPVDNSQWSLKEIRKFKVEYTLELKTDDLGPTVDSCPILEGIVTEVGTGAPVAGAYISYLYGIEPASITTESGSYRLYMPVELPEADIFVYAEGYQVSVLSSHSSITHMGGNRFSLNIELEPDGK